MDIGAFVLLFALHVHSNQLQCTVHNFAFSLVSFLLNFGFDIKNSWGVKIHIKDMVMLALWSSVENLQFGVIRENKFILTELIVLFCS